MNKFNILMASSAVALLATGCVKPTQANQPNAPIYSDTTQQGTQGIYNTTQQDTQSIYNTTQTAQQDTQSIYNGTTTQGTVYEEAQPIVYTPAQTDSTVITTPGVSSQPVSTGVTYPDPYANAGTNTVNNNPYVSQPVATNYPAPVTTTAPVSQGSGIQLQIAALKDYYTAEDYKNKLSLAPGLSAYVQRGAMNKVIVTGIPSMAEANRLKERRFPGSFIVQGGASTGYTPPIQPNYDTSSSAGSYNVNNPYGVASSSASTGSGIGVQVGAFGSMGKAQSVANSQSGSHAAIVKKIGRYYKVILTGFSSRSAARTYATNRGGFVVNY